MSTAASDLPDARHWLAQSIRLTAFPAQPASIDDSGWWKAVTGDDPETFTQQKLKRQYEGAVASTQLTLAIDPLRIQWNQVPIANVDELPEGIPVLGQFEESRDAFSAMMEKWFPVSPPLVRLAFGAVLFMPAADHSAAYAQLAEFLPDIPIGADASDFSFKINRRRPSSAGISGMTINRLASWGAISWHVVLKSGGFEGSPPPEYACKLNLDINNVPLSEAIPHESVHDLWVELTQIATDVATRGDIE